MSPMFPKTELVDHFGAWRTLSLFKETNQSALEPLMTLKEIDYEYKGKLLPSLKKIYLATEDTTEYLFAINTFGSWKCWQKLCGNKQIFAHIAEWREELEIKLRANALKSIYETAMVDGAKGVAAAKYIAEKGWEKRAGRPTKLDVAKAAKIESGISQALNDDAIRMGLSVE